MDTLDNQLEDQRQRLHVARREVVRATRVYLAKLDEGSRADLEAILICEHREALAFNKLLQAWNGNGHSRIEESSTLNGLVDERKAA